MSSDERNAGGESMEDSDQPSVATMVDEDLSMFSLPQHRGSNAAVEIIRNQPLAAVLLAAATGLLLGRLLK